MTTRKGRSMFRMFGIGVLAAMLMMLVSPMTALAFNPPPALNQPAPEQQRFDWYYEFESGMDYRFDLGRPTTHHGAVQQDVMTANVRRDANASFRPPGPRVGNTITPTDPSNWAFTRQQHHVQINGFWHPVEHHNTNALPHFDTMQQGVNSNQGDSGFLPPTSIR